MQRCFAGHDERIGLRIQGIRVLAGLSELAGVEQGESKIVLKSQACNFFGRQSAIRADRLRELGSRAVAHALAVVLEENGEVANGRLVVWIKLDSSFHRFNGAVEITAWIQLAAYQIVLKDIA